MNAPFTPQTRSRLDKLRALAESGCGGERDNAERSLNAMLKQHGFTREQFDAIDADPAVERALKYADDDDKGLLSQVLCVVLNRARVQVFKRPDVRRMYFVERRDA